MGLFDIKHQFAIWAAASLLALPAFADDQSSAVDHPKLRIEGDVLIYDTENVPDDVDDGIDSEDIDPLLALLRANDQITTLQLNSDGGSVWAAGKMADIVIDFELNTVINGDCDSSCVTLFMAGTKRSMTRGSRMGFHQTYWNHKDIKAYYNRERENSDWATEFEFAEWLYEDTQTEVYEHLSYLVSRGVDPAFAIKTMQKNEDGMWRPYRVVLRGAGVLTD
jgi:hypothetical protein